MQDRRRVVFCKTVTEFEVLQVRRLAPGRGSDYLKAFPVEEVVPTLLDPQHCWYTYVNVQADAEALNTIVRTEVSKYPDFRIMLGPEVLEMRPNNDLNKGTTLKQVTMIMGYPCSEYAVPLFIGDDRTDEDAFKVVRRLRSSLSKVVSAVPKETDANYSLRDPTEVVQLLKLLVEWKNMM